MLFALIMPVCMSLFHLEWNRQVDCVSYLGGECNPLRTSLSLSNEEDGGWTTEKSGPSSGRCRFYDCPSLVILRAEPPRNQFWHPLFVFLPPSRPFSQSLRPPLWHLSLTFSPQMCIGRVAICAVETEFFLHSPSNLQFLNVENPDFSDNSSLVLLWFPTSRYPVWPAL